MKLFLIVIFVMTIISLVPILDVFASIDSPRNISVKSTLTENPGTTGDVFC